MSATELSGMIGVDVGGTFTDVVSVLDGKVSVTKVPTDVNDTEKSVIDGAAAIGAAGHAVFNHASTVGLNAVITRRLPKVAFLTTVGQRDMLDMGRTWRPLEALTDPHWRRSFGDASAPLVPRYLRRGIQERMLVDGSILFELDEAQARAELEVLKKCDIDGIAICLINAYVSGVHEVRLRELVTEVLGDDVACSISSEVSPLAKEYNRASTTVIDVFMKIIYSSYTTRLVDGLRGVGFEGQVNFADCAAMLMASQFAMTQPFRLVFSGPAAGTVGSAHFGEAIGDKNLFCCDVGGTSSDISLVTDGHPFVNTTFELEHDLVINALSNEVNSLGAGGGSIIWIKDTGEIAVGPDSAGADPGPAVYGRGGTKPTMTDACVLMGILDPTKFLGGKMELRTQLAETAFASLDTSLDLEQRVAFAWNMGLNNIAEGLLQIAIEHGVDPRDYTLLAYGAAGPMMLPGVLDLVHARRVIVPPYPGLFSALGLLSSDLVYSDSRSLYTVLDESSAPAVNEIYESIEEDLLQKLNQKRENVEIKRTLDARLLGQTWETPFVDVPAGTIGPDEIATMVDSFHVTYQARAGNRFALPVQGVTYRVQVIVEVEKVQFAAAGHRNGSELKPVGKVQMQYLGADGTDSVEADEYQRDDLHQGDEILGPAIIREAMSTTYLVSGQRLTVGTVGELIIENA
jgi:N-methylhydantoinase A